MITPQPRHLLDLPDEILFIILRYCFQDMDFLLWSCPLIKTENQFCHDCYYCPQCHSPSNMNNKRDLNFNSTYNTNATRTRDINISSSNNSRNSDIRNSTNSNRTGISSNANCSSNSNLINDVSDTILRKQRRKTFAKGDQVESTCSRKKSSQCGCDQQSQFDFTPRNRSFWSRRLARLSFRSRQHVHPCHLLSPTSPSFTFNSSRISPISITTTGLSRALSVSQQTQHGSRLIETDASEATNESVYRAPTTAGALLPIAFLESLPLSSHASLQQPKDCSKGSSEVQHAEKEIPYTNSLSLPISYMARRGPRSSNPNAATYSYLRAINRSHPFLSLESDAGGIDKNMRNKGDNSSSSISRGETINSQFRRSTPFQLLLVNRRFASMVVQLLWNSTVFHGHDINQVESLISTLYEKSSSKSSDGPDIFHSDPAKFQDLESQYQEKNLVPCATSDDARWEGVPHTRSSFIMQRGCSKTIPSRHSAHAREQNQQPCITSSEHHQGCCRPMKGKGIFENGNYTTSNKGGSSSERDAIPCNKYIEMNPLPVPGRDPCTGESQSKKFASKNTDHLALLKNNSLWSYRHLVSRAVLNFAHPQSSPQLLVKALECIGTRCHDQIQSFDLHANEKMQAAGLEIPSELERLFKLGFSKLRYLRLQGGLIDNQLFGALVSGLAGPQMSVCRLSHVFLGPGSITDSAIDKLINAASHCLEVFAVTSCVDVSGGALASLLTSCPKLRVLSVHRSIAKDKELLEGLGIEIENNSPSSSILGSPSSTVAHNNPSKVILAPLERLELGMVKFTDVGVAAIIKGTSTTLRFLVLEMQHFKDDLLKHTIAPLCKMLEGLYFVEPDHPPQQQRQQALHGHGLEEQRVRRRFFDIRRNRRSSELHIRNYGHQDFDHRSPRAGPIPRQSPWLGETSTDEWVLYGDCALWAASTIGSTVAPRYDSTQINANLDLENHLAEQSRTRSFSAYFRALSRRIVSMMSTGNTVQNNIGNDADIAENTVNTVDPEASTFPENDYESLLLRCGVNPNTIQEVVNSLQPSLLSFTALQTDVIQANIDWVEKHFDNSFGSDAVLANEGLDTFVRLLVLLGVLVFGAAVSVSTP